MVIQSRFKWEQFDLIQIRIHDINPSWIVIDDKNNILKMFYLCVFCRNAFVFLVASLIIKIKCNAIISSYHSNSIYVQSLYQYFQGKNFYPMRVARYPIPGCHFRRYCLHAAGRQMGPVGTATRHPCRLHIIHTSRIPNLLCRKGLILGLHPANERHCYFVTTSLIGWAQT